MNPIEKQLQLGRELMELNAKWFQQLAEFEAANFQKYVEVSQKFAARLPEISDLQGLSELQREYGETLWNNTQEALKTRSDLLRQATEATGEVFKEAFSSAAADAEKAPESGS